MNKYSKDTLLQSGKGNGYDHLSQNNIGLIRSVDEHKKKITCNYSEPEIFL